MKAKAIPILVLLSGLLVSIVVTVARSHPQEKAEQLSEWEVVGLMRTINTAQAEASSDSDLRHQYLSLDELVARRHYNSSELWLPTLQMVDSSTGTLKNYRVSVVVSPDRQHYVAQLINSSDCGLAVFSNESVLIYTARILDCKDEKSPNKDR